MFPTRKNKASKGYQLSFLLWIKQSVTVAFTVMSIQYSYEYTIIIMFFFLQNQGESFKKQHCWCETTRKKGNKTIKHIDTIIRQNLLTKFHRLQFSAEVFPCNNKIS